MVSATVRTRVYWWDWFGADPDGEYSYPAVLTRIGVSAARPRVDWQIEMAIPVILGLPTAAVEPAPRGALGLGGNYFAANANSANDASLLLKQAFIRLKRLGGRDGQSLRLGRLEINDGTETAAGNGTVAALKRDRIAQRLIGAFGFTDVGRSVDGAEYRLAGRRLTATALGGRPTAGVFDVNGWPELEINLLYGTLTGVAGVPRAGGEWRLFALLYDDRRRISGKADNRAAAVRNADRAPITIGTLGGNYIAVIDSRGGPIDLLGWIALQSGSWGALSHRAAAAAMEIGWQPRAARTVNAWIRTGLDYGSGDGGPGDSRHGTFFQLLPTPRIYARLPFYNMMNDRDLFLAVTMRPIRSLTVRADAHSLALADPADLWYSGGGAFESGTFGFTGRPSGGRTGLAALYDVSADWTLTRHVSAAGYFGWASAGPVPSAIYGSGSLRFAYLELLIRL
jgi:hypothetical protein